MSVKTDDVSGDHISPMIRRTRTGCVQCRIRRKKCDEMKPKCLGCQRNQLLCCWADENSNSSNILRRPSKCVKKNTKDSILPGSPTDGYPESKSILSASQTEQQIGNQWSRLNNAVDKIGATSSRIVLDLIPASKLALVRQPMSQVFFEYYLHRTNKTLSVCQNSYNPFLAELLPLAIGHESILHSLLALSGIHYAETTRRPVDVMTWTHYGQALQGQKYGLTSLSRGNTESVLALLVTALILSTLETTRGHSSSLGMYHVRGARQLLQLFLGLETTEVNRRTRSFVLERYAYTIALADISIGHQPDDWVAKDVSHMFALLEADPAAGLPSIHMTCVHELFRMIPKVSYLARKRQSEIYLNINNPDTLSAALALQHEISSWSSQSSDQIYTVCGQVYQQALLVYLLASFGTGNSIDDSEPYTDDIANAFTSFMTLLESITISPAICNTICWPLVIFGSCARTSKHRGLITNYLEVISTSLGVGNMRDALTLLKKLWGGNDPLLYVPLSLEKMMKEEGKIVLLF